MGRLALRTRGRRIAAASAVTVSALVAAPIASAAINQPQHKAYNDVDVVQYVVFASGRIAQQHPDLAARIRHGRTIKQPSAGQLRQLVTVMKKYDPAYTQKVTNVLLKGDPYAATPALQRLGEDLTAVLAPKQAAHGASLSQQSRINSIAHADGWFWHDEWAVTETTIVAAWQGAVYTTVGGFAEAVVVVAIVPAAASYQFEMNSAADVDRQGFTAAVAQGCAS